MSDTNSSFCYRPFQRGEMIGDFEILSPIGHGAYGDVYYVKDPLDKKFALKVVREEISEASSREISGISLLRTQIRVDECIPVIYHVGHIGENIYYTMDPADNCSLNPESYVPDTLQHRLDIKLHYSLDEVLEITKSLLNSIKTLHQHDLVHRDIKPSNIIFIHGQCMLTDFGLVSANPKTLVGSPGFLAPYPEGGISLKTEKEADLYSLGKVIYCLFTGEPVERFPLLPENIQLDDLAVIRPIYQKACATAVSKRFHSCEEFLQAVESAQNQRTTMNKTKKVMMTGIICLCVLLGAAVAFFLVRNKTKTSAAPLEDVKTPHVESVAQTDDDASEAYVKVCDEGDSYHILCCFRNSSDADSDPHYRPNQFKAMSFVKKGLAQHMQASDGQAVKIRNIAYLRQPFREGSLLVYIYSAQKKDCSLIGKQ